MFSKILVGFDGSGRSEDALLFARQLARLGAGGITAVCVYGYRRSTRMNIRTGLFAGTLDDAEQTLVMLRETSLGDGIDVRAVAGLSAAGGLHALAEDEDADLIVVGSTERGRAGRTLPGSTADRLLNGAPCGVVVVPLGYRGRAAGLQRVGVAYCPGAEAASASLVARSLAAEAGAALTVVSVFDRDVLPLTEDVDDARRASEARLAEVLAQLSDGVAVAGELIDGEAVEVLRERSEALDMIVMGSRAYGPVRRTLLGSVSHGLLVDSLCPVLVIPRGPATERPSASPPSGPNP